MMNGHYRYSFPRPSRPDGALPTLDDTSGAYQGIVELIESLVFLHSAFRELADAGEAAVDGISDRSRNVQEAVGFMQAVQEMNPLFEECGDFTANALVSMVRVLLRLAEEPATEPIEIEVTEVP